MNGAVSNLAVTPYAVTTLRRELAAGRFDVIHVHEPVAPVVGYDVLDFPGAPLVGTFHAYSENRLTNGLGNVVAGSRRKLNAMRRAAMARTYGWQRSARRYKKVYDRAVSALTPADAAAS